MDWLEFATAFVVFFVTHSVPLRPPLRSRLRAWLGARGFALVYSGASLAALAWLIAAAARAPHLPLWGRAPWQTLVPVLVMLPVCLMLALAIARPNPFSFGGACNERFDLSRPGIVRLTRHPLLAALALWAGAHVVPNGDVAHVVLFGTFAGFAALGGRLVDRRRRHEMGAAWARLDARRRAAPLPPRPASWWGAMIRFIGGAALYLLFLAAHPWLFGVSPLP